MEPETLELRYVLGELTGPVLVDPEVAPAPASEPSEPTVSDRIAKIVDVSKAGATLAFPGEPGVVYLDPVECRIVYLPVGHDVPTSVAAWLGSGHPASLHQGPVPQGPDSTLVIPLPDGLPKNHYLVQPIFGFSG